MISRSPLSEPFLSLHALLHPCKDRDETHSLGLGQLLGSDLVGLFAAGFKVIGPIDGASLRGRLGVPNGDLSI